MGQNQLRLLAAAAALLAALPVAAAFHFWSMNEVYSNADGSVQFIELTALAGGQQFVGNHSITSNAATGGATRNFVFPNNLPGDTAGRRFLIGTQGFAALGVVTPDYIVPNGFVFASGGTLNFAEGSDTWAHPALPPGTLSLNRDGSTDTNSPRNFSGQTGTVPPPPVTSVNAQGLWWGGTAENGWGVNIAHQGDLLFATWFTYDTDGSQMWLVAPETRLVSGKTYSGPLFRTTGNVFSATPWNTAIGVTEVGRVTFEFVDAFNGRFTYTVGTVTQFKNISLQEFGPIPICEANGATGPQPVYQDLWWASPAQSQSGWGVNVNHQGNIVFATWFTYGADGKGIWVVLPRGERVGTTESFTGPLFRTTGPAFSVASWNPALVVATEVGTATFTFANRTAGTFAYTHSGVTQSKPIVRQVFSTPLSVCRAP